MEEDRKRYKQYLRNPEKPIPTTTAWRLKRKLDQSQERLPQTTDNAPISDCPPSSLLPKRRKLYCRNPSYAVPRQTLHLWKNISSSKDGDPSVSKNSDPRSLENGGPSGSEDGDPSGSEDGDPGGSEDGDPGGSEGGDPGGSENGGPSGSEDGDPSGSEDGDPGGSEDGDPSGSENGDSGGSEDGDPSGSEDGDPSGSEDEDPGGSEDGDPSGSENGDPGGSEDGDPGGSEDGDPDPEDEMGGNNAFKLPLFESAPLSTEASWYAIYQYAVSNKLSYQATAQLLELIRIHCPSPNSGPKSLYLLKKHLSNMKHCSSYQYCSHCMDEVPTSQKHCIKRDCKKNSAQLCYFSVLPFEEHLKDLFSERWKELQYPFTRNVIPNKLQDIQDGEEYRKLAEPGEFLSFPEHAGLILCSDGVQLFKSCGQSLWPIQLAIANFPPDTRMNIDNLLLAGVWLGPVKPDMGRILLPVLKRIEKFYYSGVETCTPEGLKRVKACLLVGVFDLIAKAMATNCTQFNGHYGCLYCLDKGQHVSHRHLYFPDEDHQPRTSQQNRQWARQAKAFGTTKYGVKGKSPLSRHISIVTSVPIDYMHAVLEGVMKTLLTCWLNKKHHSRRYYLGRNTPTIDQKLLRIKPPHEFRRTPRSILTFKYWKASELRAFLLYYALPVLMDILPSDYIHHLSLLVSALHLLLSDCIDVTEVAKAQQLLTAFHTLIPDLYPLEMLTANMHSLLHLNQFVNAWGPLWSYSCFGFESMNGHLRKHIHGTRNVLPQLIHNFRMRQMLPLIGKRIEASENSRTVAFLRSLLPSSATKGDRRLADVTSVVGRVKHRNLNEKEREALTEANYNPDISMPAFSGVRHGSITFTSQREKRTLKCSSVCAFHHASGMQFGSIQLLCYGDGIPIAVIDIFKQTGEGILTSLRNPTLDGLQGNLTTSINDFVFMVKKLSTSNKTVAVPVSSIFAKCVHIPIKYSPYDFIITIPNPYEHH